MNYRHAYHAGNFADVMKHLALVLVLEHLKLKEKAFFFLDTHAGTGLTDLRSEAAQKTGEFREGISRILAASQPPALLEPYLGTLAGLGCDAGNGGPRSYPGSPLIAAHLARHQDRLVFCELHPQDAPLLNSHFVHDARATVMDTNGYAALKSLLPPRERRGAVLIDPPFESRAEFEELFDTLTGAIRRWATGTYLIWYPVKDPAVSGAFIERLATDGPDKILVTELHTRTPDGVRMSGCGLVIVNPPWRLDEELSSAYDFLAGALAQGEGARARVEWLRK